MSLASDLTKAFRDAYRAPCGTDESALTHWCLKCEAVAKERQAERDRLDALPQPATISYPADDLGNPVEP